ncbi:hypothetical protein KH5_05710 [Urechidicola sp. KH5]
MKNRKSYLIFAAILLTAFSSSLAQSDSQKAAEVLAKKRAYKKKNPTGKGYKIQLYNGNETQAYRFKNEYELVFKKKAELLYESPEWKVRVGNYRTRLEADRALLEIKKEFRGAIVLITDIEL